MLERLRGEDVPLKENANNNPMELPKDNYSTATERIATIIPQVNDNATIEDAKKEVTNIHNVNYINNSENDVIYIKTNTKNKNKYKFNNNIYKANKRLLNKNDDD